MNNDSDPQPPSPQPAATILRAGIEELESNCWVLSIFDLIGCYSSGQSEEEAIAQASRRVRQYFEWLGKKDGNSAPFDESIQVTIVERFQRYPWAKDPATLVCAFFEDDARPLRPWDIDIALRLLDWNRQDFLLLTGSLLPDSPIRKENEPNWNTLDGLLGHMWETENGILGAMGAAVDLAEMPSDAMGRAQVVRAKLRKILPEWAGLEIQREVAGELWTPRKALRRALWHERDHIWQVEPLIKQIQQTARRNR